MRRLCFSFPLRREALTPFIVENDLDTWDKVGREPYGLAPAYETVVDHSRLTNRGFKAFRLVGDTLAFMS